MITNTDHLRDIAEDLGLDTSWSESAWPNFLTVFHVYMKYREHCEYNHEHAIKNMRMQRDSPWCDIFYDLHTAIMDEPELYY